MKKLTIKGKVSVTVVKIISFSLLILMIASCSTPVVTTERLAKEATQVPPIVAGGLRPASLPPRVGPLKIKASQWKAPEYKSFEGTRIVLPVTLSPGDRLQISVSEGETFSGMFEVDLDGTLHIPYLKPIPVIGLTAEQLQEVITENLVSQGLFQPGIADVSVVPRQWAPIWVSITGAVFKPGRAMINERNIEERTHQLTQLSGDFADGRFLTTALKGAGGIRPDADVSAVKLVRNGEVYSFDVSGIFTGEPFKDVPLIDGDQVIVHSLDHYQPELMHLSPITPPGFTVFSSKLVEPSPSNSQATVAQAISVPYGTRLLRGLIAANCVGGIQTTNASRYAILVSTNLLTEQVFVIERSVDELIENADDFQVNPYLMPDDGIACYDSNTTNVRDAAKTIVEILSPLGIIKGLLLL